MADVENNLSPASPAATVDRAATAEAPSQEQTLLVQLRHASDLIAGQRLEEAEAELEAAQKTSSRDLRVLKLLALVRFKLGRLREARDVYRVACEVSPDDPTVRLNLGLIALKLESFAEASVELEAAVRLQPDDRRAWSYLGYAYARSSDPAQAAAAFRRAGQHELAAEMERAAAPAPESAVVEEGRAAVSVPGAPAETTPRPALTSEATPVPERRTPEPSPSSPALSSLASFTTAGLLSLEAASPSIPVASLGKGVLRFSAGAQSQTYVRQSCLVLAVGGQRLSSARRRFRGHLSDRALADANDRFFQVDGAGDLLLSAPDAERSLVALSLDRDVLYLDEERVAAWGDDIVWEAGAVPGGDKRMLQFRGSGRVVLLVAPDEILAVPLAEGQQMAAPTDRLVGWLGRIVVQGVPPAQSSAPADGLHHVTCEGEGVLLLARHAEHP